MTPETMPAVPPPLELELLVEPVPLLEEVPDAVPLEVALLPLELLRVEPEEAAVLALDEEVALEADEEVAPVLAWPAGATPVPQAVAPTRARKELACCHERFMCRSSRERSRRRCLGRSPARE